MPTVEVLLDEAEALIKRSKAVDLWRQSDARVNAEELLGAVLDKEITSDHLDDDVSKDAAKQFRSFVRRRVSGEPVAIIIGKTEFMGMWLKVRKGVFIPRNSSELMALEAIRRLRGRTRPVAVDLATGCGTVALAIAKKVPRAQVFGVDISTKAVELAAENAADLSIPNASFLQGDLLGSLHSDVRGKVDTMTIHPPYVARSEVRTLPKEIRDFEPVHTLTDSSTDGLGLVRRLATEAPAWLRPGGWVLVEVSSNLSRQVKGILQRSGFREVKSHRDSLGATRVVAGTHGS